MPGSIEGQLRIDSAAAQAKIFRTLRGLPSNLYWQLRKVPGKALTGRYSLATPQISFLAVSAPKIGSAGSVIRPICLSTEA